MNLVLKNKYSTCTSKGVLSKGWYIDPITGIDYLVKGNSFCYVQTRRGYQCVGNYEPYSEVMASRIGRLLGIDCVEYTLEPSCNFPEIDVYDVQHVSVCKKIDLQPDDEMISFYTFLKFLPGNISHCWPSIPDSPISDNIYKMLILDAFIGNEDRHLNNWDIIKSRKNGFKYAPLLDFGASLLARKTDIEISEKKTIVSDRSRPFKQTHVEQVAMIKNKFNKKFIDIQDKEIFHKLLLKEIDDVLSLLDSNRANAISKYLNDRFVYLEDFIKRIDYDKNNEQ